MSGDFYAKIRDFTLSAKGARKKVVTFLLHKPEEAAFMTIEGLAAVSGVSAGMVSRTVREMGFNGFADMQNQIRQVVRKNITPSARMRRIRQDGTISFRDTIRWELKNLAQLMKLNSEETVYKAATMLAHAQAVHIMGLRSSFAPAYSLAFGLAQIRQQVHLMDLSSGLLAEQAKRVNPEDLMVLISFPRYVKESLLMAQEAKTAGCEILAITDSFSSPLTMQADVALLAPFESLSFFNSTIAMYGITNALLVKTAQILDGKGVRELERLNAIEQRWKLLISSEDAWRPNLKND